MTNNDYVPFLINDRSSAMLHLIDAFQLTESELHDVYDGVFNRMKEYFDSGDRPDNEPIKEIGIFEGENSIIVTDEDLLEDDRDPSEKPCPCGEGTTTLRDCDGRPCGFYRTYEDIPMCPPEIAKELGGIFDDEAMIIKQSIDGILNELKTNDEPLLFEVKPLEAYMLLAMVQAAIVSLPIPENLDKFGREFIEAFCKRYQLMFPDICKSLYLGWTTHLTKEEFDELVDSDDDDLTVEEFLNSDVLIYAPDFVMDDYQDDFPA